MITPQKIIKTIALSATILAVLSCGVGKAQKADTSQQDSYAANDRQPDPRLKADILLVVAHPDDEVLATSYLAREIYDEHKSVAIVYATRGDGGSSEIGPEHGLSLGSIREIEGRQAAASLGITNVWFLTGRDTLSQNVLNSLEHWDHGACLGQLVRLIRLTRPSVIITFLPVFATGENHADHQAAGVLATEAFDLAGDPSVFSEQISPASYSERDLDRTEGLQPWQPEKIYYFNTPTHDDIFAGRGPQYPAKGTSPSRHVTYGMLAAEALAHHRTQGGDHVTRAIENHTLDNSQDSYVQLATMPVQLFFGRSLVPSGVTDDVFAGVVPGGIPFQQPARSPALQDSNPAIKIGDPWNFYQVFLKAHGIGHLANVVAPEITVKVGRVLSIPLIIDNPFDTTIKVDLSVQAPSGWKVTPTAAVSIDPHSRYFIRVQASAPETLLPGWQNFNVSAKSGNQTIGTVPIRVELSSGWVAPQ